MFSPHMLETTEFQLQCTMYTKITAAALLNSCFCEWETGHTHTMLCNIHDSTVFKCTCVHVCTVKGVTTGKSETCQDAETGILKSKPEMKKCSDLLRKANM